MSNKTLSITLKAIDQASAPAKLLETNLSRLGPTSLRATMTAMGGMQRYVTVLKQASDISGKMLRTVTGASAASGMGAVMRHVATMRTLVAGIAAAGAVRGMSSMVDRLDEMGEKAREFGVSVQTWSVLESAAERNNASVESLAQGYRRLQQMMDRVVRTGKGPGADLLDRLGVSPTAQGQMRATSDLIRDIESRVRGLDASARRGALQELFGRGGSTAWERVFAQGFGATADAMRRMDAIVTPAQVAAAKRLDESLNNIRAAWRGVYQDILTSIEPTVTRLLDRVGSTIVAVKQNGSAVLDAIGTAIAGGPGSNVAAQLLGQLRDNMVSVLGTSIVELVKLAANTFSSIVGTNVFVLLPRVGSFLIDVLKKAANEAITYWNGTDIAKRSGMTLSPMQLSGEGRLSQLRENIDAIRSLPAGARTASNPALQALLNERNSNRRDTMGTDYQNGLIETRRRYFEFGAHDLQAAENLLSRETSRVRAEQEASTRTLISDLATLWEPTAAQLRTSREVIGKEWEKVQGTLGDIRSLFYTPDPAKQGGEDLILEKVTGISFRALRGALERGGATLRDLSRRVVGAARQEWTGLRERAAQAAGISLDLRARELTAGGSNRELMLLQQARERFELERKQGPLYAVIAERLGTVQRLELSRFDITEKLAAVQKQAAEAEERLTQNAEYRQSLVTSGTLSQLRADELAKSSTRSYLAEMERLKAQVAGLRDQFPQLWSTAAPVLKDLEKASANWRYQLEGPTPGQWRSGVMAEVAELRRRSEDLYSFARSGTQSITESLTGGLASALVQTKWATDQLAESMRNWAGTAFQDLARLATQMLLIRALSSAIGMFGGGGGGAFSGVTGSVGAPSWVGAVNRGGIAGFAATPTVPMAGYARGGIVQNGLAINRDSVLATLTRGEAVLNRRATQRIGAVGVAELNAGTVGGGGGGGVSITINVMGGGGGSDARGARVQGREIAAAVANELARNGMLRQQFKAAIA